MELTKTEVFECPKCESLSKKKEDVIKCLQRHRKEELKTEKQRAFFDLQDRLNLILINNLKSFRAEDVKSILVDAARMVGYELNFTGFSHSGLEKDYRQVLCSNYSIAGSFKKSGPSEFSGIKIPSTCSIYLRDLLDAKHSTYVGDMFRAIKGIDVYSGGGGENFSYTLKLFVDYFPDLKEAYEEYLVLDGAKKSYISRASELSAEYKKNILPAVLHSDIPFQELQMEYDDLHEKIEDLHAQFSIISSKMSDRQAALYNQHSKKFVIPEEAYSYNSERLVELKRRLF